MTATDGAHPSTDDDASVIRGPELRRNLEWWQILAIAISGIIGVTIFADDGEVLEIGGPGSTLAAFAIVGCVAIFVMEGLSELVQLFPAPNALVEYVSAFVDKDLGVVVGVAYWYTWASIFATQLIAAANFATYWDLSEAWQIGAFYLFAPLVILCINFAGVRWYGLIETFGGVLKLCMVLGGGIYLFAVASEMHNSNRCFIEDGFKVDKSYAYSKAAAVCAAIPIIAYGFLGVEITAVTAFESADYRSLRFPSQSIAYIISVAYFFCALAEVLNVSWTDPALPHVYNGHADNAKRGLLSSTAMPNNGHLRTNTLILITALRAGHGRFSAFFNGCLIFNVLSASNTSLYIASRTLYGLTWKIRSETWPLTWISRIGTVMPGTGVPGWALVISAVSFCWLPFLNIKKGYGVEDLIQIMSISGSVSCLLVWAAECLAFLRYYKWLQMHASALQRDRHNTHHAKFVRNADSYGASTILGYFQPVVAWIGFIGSMIIALVFTTATWWREDVNISKAAIAYAAPILFVAIFIALKIRNPHGWVRLDEDFAVFTETLFGLEYHQQGEYEGIWHKVGRELREKLLGHSQSPSNRSSNAHEQP